MVPDPVKTGRTWPHLPEDEPKRGGERHGSSLQGHGGSMGEVRMGEVRVVVSGRVQGVGYRYFVRDAALRRNIRGWVRNNPDGTVSIAAAGEGTSLEQFLEEIRARGDPLIRVDEISVTWTDARGEWNGFEIRR